MQNETIPTGLRALYDSRAALLQRWFELYVQEVGTLPHLDAEAFRATFGRELEQLLSPEFDLSADRRDAALRSTAGCLARQNVPLTQLVAAATTGTIAGRAIAGRRADSALESHLAALEAARVREYSRAYLARARNRADSRHLPLLDCELAAPRLAPDSRYGLVGQSPASIALAERVESVSRLRRNALLVGEPGSGREHVARALHAAAGREGQFVRVDCAALPRAAVDVLLFGRGAGATSGARAEETSMFWAAQRGTLFLRNLAALPIEAQTRLAQVLHDRAIRVAGATRLLPIDLLVTASVSGDFEADVRAGRLRADLVQHLRAGLIVVPTLRDRAADVRLFVEHFLASHCAHHALCVGGMTPAAIQALERADWPGNLAELRDVTERAVATNNSGWIRVVDLPPRFHALATEPANRTGQLEIPTLAKAEEELVLRALEQFHGNKVRAARALGISRHKLYDVLRRVGVAA